MKTVRLIIVIAFISLCNSFAQDIPEYNTKEEASNKLGSMIPKEVEFIFKNPNGWKAVSLSSANILMVSEGEDKNEAFKIIDGKTNTTWQTKSFYKKPEVIIDLGSIQKFDRIVLYNRHTNNRGTAGGNNAIKTLELSYSKELNSPFALLGKYELHGPKPACVRIKDVGQMCTFIDDPEPNIIETPTTDARYLKLSFKDAFWGDSIPDSWRDSFSLSEVMLFNK